MRRPVVNTLIYLCYFHANDQTIKSKSSTNVTNNEANILYRGKNDFFFNYRLKYVKYEHFYFQDKIKLLGKITGRGRTLIQSQ